MLLEAGYPAKGDISRESDKVKISATVGNYLVEGQFGLYFQRNHMP